MITIVTPTIRPEGLLVTQGGLTYQTYRDFEWLVEVGIPDRGHDLNAAYNRMLKRAKGELVVFLQDYIRVQPDYLEKFWAAYQKDKKTFYTAAVGKVKSLDFNGIVKFDWRSMKPGEMPWYQWEIDSAAAPLNALKEIGGFDETLDGHWSGDNVNVACRAELAGYKFANIDNPSVAYDHDSSSYHPFRESYNPKLNNERMNEFRRGLKINYI